MVLFSFLRRPDPITDADVQTVRTFLDVPTPSGLVTALRIVAAALPNEDTSAACYQLERRVNRPWRAGVFRFGGMAFWSPEGRYSRRELDFDFKEYLLGRERPRRTGGLEGALIDTMAYSTLKRTQYGDLFTALRAYEWPSDVTFIEEVEAPGATPHATLLGFFATDKLRLLVRETRDPEDLARTGVHKTCV